MTLVERLTEKLREVEGLRREWLDLRKALVDELHTPAVGRMGLDAPQKELDDVIAAFAREVEAPNVVLVVTGTTGAGKSSLVNYLCGVDVAPVAVQEMSAGVVRLQHHEGGLEFEIEATPGATWETGVFAASTAAAISERLARTFDAYRRSDDAAPPSATVRLPMRIGAAGVLGLPPGARLSILDLPGLAFVGDEKNAAVFRSEVARGLCIVTGSALETGDREQALVAQIVQQVRELRGTPARMLFVANRIDEFLKDPNPDDKRREWLTGLAQRTRAALVAALPEYGSAIASIELLPLSSRPALLAHLVKMGDSSTAEQFKELDEFYGKLIPAPLREELPRNVAKATPEQRREVGEAVAVTSHARAFDERLREHLSAHLPELLLPQWERAIGDAVGALLRLTTQELSVRIDNERRSLEENLRRLDEAANALKATREATAALLQPLTEYGPNKPRAFDDLSRTIETIANGLKIPKNDFGKLTALYDWKASLNKQRRDFFRALKAALKPGGKLDAALALTDKSRKRLEEAIARAVDAGYVGTMVATGEKVKVTNDRKKLETLCSALELLSTTVHASLNEILDQESSNQSDRIHESLVELLRAQQNAINVSAKKIEPELVLVLPESLRYRTAGPRLKIQSKVAIGSIKDDTKTYQSGTKVVEREGFLGWLVDLVYEKRVPVWKTDQIAEAYIPSIDEIEQFFDEQWQRKDNGIDASFFLWLERELARYEKDVVEFHQSHYERTARRLRELKEGKQEAHAMNVAPLQLLRERANAIASRIGPR